MHLIKRLIIILLSISLFSMNSMPILAKEEKLDTSNEEIVLPTLNYVYVDKEVYEEKENVVIAVSIEGVTDVSLKIKGNDQVYSISSDKQKGHLYRFTTSFNAAGIYEIISVVCGNNEYLMADYGMHPQIKVVKQTISMEAMNAVDESHISVEVGNEQDSEQIAEAIVSVKNNANDSNLVICIDPGHGGYDSGTYTAAPNVYEKDLNLKVALYLKEYLEQYKDVTVVMTRSTDVYLGNEERNDLQQRAYIASLYESDFFISIHQNAVNGQARGAMVFYPNENYKPELSGVGKMAAEAILEELVALGIDNRGVQTRTIDDDDDDIYKYEDGSNGDYYGVIRNCKKYGIPGIIIEHAFADNVSDYNSFLSSDEKLKALAQADCKGIVKAFDLTLKDGNSTTIKNGFKYFDTKWHYYENGELVVGWKEIKNQWHYFNENGEMVTGPYEINGKIYYFDADGIMQTGWQKDGSDWFFIGADGIIVTGWIQSADNWYYMNQNGKMVKGWNKINGSWYYFNTGGIMQTGWLKDNDHWYYLQSNGVMNIGWIQVGNIWYYMNARGIMETGWQYVNGHWYFFESSGAMKKGWHQENKKWYYFDEHGIMNIGWILIGKDWYYMDAHGVMLTGWQKINGYWYFIQSNGIMLKGWMQMGNNWYYLNDHGIMNTGWILIGNDWYYMDSSGIMQTGWRQIGDSWYYLQPNGIMKKGWLDYDGNWYYLDEHGVMVTGFKEIAGQTYYMNQSGVMLTGTHIIDGKQYSFNSFGHLISSNEEKNDPPVQETNGYAIMGESNVTIDQMVKYYNRKRGVYDVFNESVYNGIYAAGGAADIIAFCTIYYEEAKAEGVKQEVAFCQAMLETGFLQFGGDVKPNQYNFAGLGATGGVPGNSFVNVRIGVRAQVQHLKCYASDQPLNNPNVDQRWWDALRLRATTVEELAGTWAANGSYADIMLAMIAELKTM